MLGKNFSNTLNLLISIVVITGIDYLVSILLIDVENYSLPVLIILFPVSLTVLLISVKIWRIVLTAESKIKAQHRSLLVFAAILTVVAVLSGLLIYLIEMILSSGLLGTIHSRLDLTSNQNEIGIAFPLMLLAYILIILHNSFGLLGSLVISVVWVRQFRVWARFSNASFIRSYYLVGMSMIVLLLDQLITITFYNGLIWIYPDIPLEEYPPIFQMVFYILFIIAAIIMPITIYFLSVAGQSLRVPHEKKVPVSRLAVILPLVFFFVWFILGSMNLVGLGIDSLIANIIQALFFTVAFIPISLGFLTCAGRIESEFLKRNLYLAAVGSLALSAFSIVGARQWTGMMVLPGYILAYSVLIWALANISQYLGSRQALSERLKEAGVQFLSEMGEAEMKVQSLLQMAKVMTDVSNGFMQELNEMAVRTPPTESEIRRYIVSTMGVEATPSENEIMAYLQDALTYVQQTGTEKL